MKSIKALLRDLKKWRNSNLKMKNLITMIDKITKLNCDLKLTQRIRN